MTNRYNSLPSLRQVVEEEGLLKQRSFSKKLGQNFLLDLELTRRIAKFATPLKDYDIVEVGPGPGGLTRAILELEPQRVFAIERDPQCINALKGLVEASDGVLTLVEKDAQKVKVQVLTKNPIKIIANLPYNVGTNLLIQWLHDLSQIASLTLMFQKEVALRITATPGSKDYGRLSILSQYLCHVKRVMDLPPHVFKPAPKVFSSVVHLTPKALSEVEKELVPHLETVTGNAFGQRRKMLRVSLKGIFNEATLSHIFETLGILPTERAENLSVAQYIQLAKVLRSQH